VIVYRCAIIAGMTRTTIGDHLKVRRSYQHWELGTATQWVGSQRNQIIRCKVQ